jgi:hypothetical protein
MEKATFELKQLISLDIGENSITYGTKGVLNTVISVIPVISLEPLI